MSPQKANTGIGEQPEWMTFHHAMFMQYLMAFYIEKQGKVKSSNINLYLSCTFFELYHYPHYTSSPTPHTSCTLIPLHILPISDLITSHPHFTVITVYPPTNPSSTIQSSLAHPATHPLANTSQSSVTPPVLSPHHWFTLHPTPHPHFTVITGLPSTQTPHPYFTVIIDSSCTTTLTHK